MTCTFTNGPIIGGSSVFYQEHLLDMNRLVQCYIVDNIVS